MPGKRTQKFNYIIPFFKNLPHKERRGEERMGKNKTQRHITTAKTLPRHKLDDESAVAATLKCLVESSNLSVTSSSIKRGKKETLLLCPGLGALGSLARVCEGVR